MSFVVALQYWFVFYRETVLHVQCILHHVMARPYTESLFYCIDVWCSILQVCHSVSGNSTNAPSHHFFCRLNCGWFVTDESLWIDVAWPEWLICYRWINMGQEDRCGLTWMVDLFQVMHCGMEDRCGLTWMVDLFQVMHCGTGGLMWLDLNGWFVTGESLRGKKIDVAWPEWLICYRRIVAG